MRLAPRTRSIVGFLRWWLSPSPLRVMGDLAVVIAASSLAGFAGDHHLAWLEVTSRAVAVVFVIPLVAAGFWMIIRALVVDPLRGYIVRRNTGEAVYFRDGVMRHKPRRRAVKTSTPRKSLPRTSRRETSGPNPDTSERHQ